MKWTIEDSNAARDQGWDVYDIWDQGTQRLSLEIQRATKPGYFKTDEAARMHVKLHGGDDLLCAKAITLVFKSKIPAPKPRSKK